MSSIVLAGMGDKIPLYQFIVNSGRYVCIGKDRVLTVLVYVVSMGTTPIGPLVSVLVVGLVVLSPEPLTYVDETFRLVSPDSFNANYKSYIAVLTWRTVS